MKSSLKIVIVALLSALFFPVQAADPLLVAITQIVAHPALDADYQGIVDELAEQGFHDGKEIIIEHEIAQGDASIAAQIAKKFVGKKPAVMVGISTPSAQTLVAAAHDRFPIVFTAVTDPIAARLVDNPERPGKNITGVSDAVPLAQNVDMIVSILPAVKRIGTVYNPGETNSTAANQELEKALTAKGMSLIKAPASKSGEVLDAARSLVGKVDAVFITLDNTAVSAFSSIVKTAETNKLPLFAADTASVAQGAIAALGFSYNDIGRATGKQIAAILTGTKAGNIPVKSLDDPALYLNPEAAKRMGVALPEAVRDRAAKIVKDK